MSNRFDKAHAFATAIVQLGRMENTSVTKAMAEIAIVLDNLITEIEDDQAAKKSRQAESASAKPAW